MKKQTAFFGVILSVFFSVSSASGTDWKRSAFPLPVWVDSNKNVVKSDIHVIVQYDGRFVSFNDMGQNMSEEGFVKKQLDSLNGGDFDAISTSAYRCGEDNFTLNDFRFMQGLLNRSERLNGIKAKYRWGGIDYLLLNVVETKNDTDSYIVVRKNANTYFSGFCYLLNPVIMNLCMLNMMEDNAPIEISRWGNIKKYKVRFKSPNNSPDERFWDDASVEVQFDGQVVETTKAHPGKKRRVGHIKNGRYGDLIDFFERDHGMSDVARFVIDGGVIKIVFWETLGGGDLHYDIFMRDKNGFKQVNSTFRGPLEELMDTQEFKNEIRRIAH